MTAATLPGPNDRRRRRRLRLIPIIGYTVVALGLAYFLGERPSTTVVFVRHADIDQTMAAAPDDAPLNARGRQRAELLADFLEDIDVVAGVNAIYASERLRTQETAAPLAKRLNLEVQIADHYDIDGFMDHVLDEHSGQIVLIVSHSDTIAPLIDELHGSKDLPPFGRDDYGDLYIVTIPRPIGKVKTLRLHYGEPPLLGLSEGATSSSTFNGGE